MNRIYTNPAGTHYVELSEYVDKKDTIQQLSAEIATRDRVGELWANFFTVLENPDPVLRRTGMSIAVFDELKRDTHVSSCIASREAGTQKRQWRLDQQKATERVTTIISDMLKEIPVLNVWREIIDAVLYGYEVLEVVWAPIDGYIVPVKIVGKPHEWFWFDGNNQLRRRDANDMLNGVPVEQRKFLLVQHKASYKNPYGEGQLGMAFWPVTFKKGGVKFWAIFLEKYGMPHAIGKLPRASDHGDRALLLGALHRMVRDAVAVFPDDSSVELLETAGKSGSSDLYERHARYHDGEISKVLLGHSAAADATPGRLGGEDGSLAVREDLIDGDAALIESAFDNLIQWIMELNPSLGTDRPKYVVYEKEGIDKTLAERDKIVADTGVSFTKEYYKKAHGYTDADIEVTPRQMQQNPAQFSEPIQQTDPQAHIDALATLLGNEFQTYIETTLKPLFELRDTCASFEEFREGLVELYPQMDSSNIEQVLEKSGLLAQVWGRYTNSK